MLQSSFLHLQRLSLDIYIHLIYCKLNNFCRCSFQYALFLFLFTSSNTPNAHKQKILNIFHIVYNISCILLLLEHHLYLLYIYFYVLFPHFHNHNLMVKYPSTNTSSNSPNEIRISWGVI